MRIVYVLLATILMVSSVSAVGLTSIISPEWDTYVDSSENTTAHNDNVSLETFFEFGGNSSSMIFEFGISTIPPDSEIKSAEVFMYVDSSNLSSDGDVFSLMPARWNSSTVLYENITWNVYLPLLLADHEEIPCCAWLDFDNNSAGWVSIDVSQILETQLSEISSGDNTLTVEIAPIAIGCNDPDCPIEGENVLVSSMEGANAPFLNVTYIPQTGGEPDGGGPGSSPGSGIGGDIKDGARIGEVLEKWNPSVYPQLRASLGNLISGSNLGDFPNKFYEFTILLVKYILREPGALAPQGGLNGI